MLFNHSTTLLFSSGDFSEHIYYLWTKRSVLFSKCSTIHCRHFSSITANLSLSTCSTSEVEADKAASSNEQSQEKEETTANVSGEKEKDTKKKASPATLADAGFITVHLKMPGVPHPVDVMVTINN